MKAFPLPLLLLTGALLLGCNRSTDRTETTAADTAPATEQEIDQMATERERQTKQAIEEQIESGDTVSTGGGAGETER